MSFLADMYWYGYGCDINKDKAFKLYNESVKRVKISLRKHILHTPSLHGNFRLGL